MKVRLPRLYVRLLACMVWLGLAAAPMHAANASRQGNEKPSAQAGKTRVATKSKPTIKAGRASASSSKLAGTKAPSVARKSARRSTRGKLHRVAREPARPSFGSLYGLHRVDDPLDLKSGAALVVDQDTNEVLVSKNAQVVLPIASLTKLMTALVVVESSQSMDQPITITADDVVTERRKGSKLVVGATLTRREVLHLALMSSENRAAHALGRSFDGGMPAFVQAMNRRASELGMTRTRFVEPTGLSSDNQSNPTDLATLVKAAYEHDLIRKLSTTSSLDVDFGERQVQYRNTNLLVSNPTWDIGLQKTGYISAAGRCLVMQASMAGRKLIMVFLDSTGKYSRLGDAERVRHWLHSVPPSKPASVPSVRPSVAALASPT